MLPDFNPRHETRDSKDDRLTSEQLTVDSFAYWMRISPSS
jgi:hypothetical protein